MGSCCQCQALPEESRSITNCLFVNDAIGARGLFQGHRRDVHEGQNTAWRISPEPFWLDPELAGFFADLGRHLLAFYRAANKLYFESVHGRMPAWVREYLDMGKPETVIDYGRMNRFKNDLPIIIRPDVFLTDAGPIATELDPVPGGFGLVAAMSGPYAELGFDIIGGRDGIPEGFAHALRALAPEGSSPVIAIVVSDESSDYREEMEWLACYLRQRGMEIYAVRPEEILFREEGLFLLVKNRPVKLDIIYRFFELFDLKNIPKIDLILYAVRKRKVVITPPLKSYLEEKLLFALFHHPVLAPFWHTELGEETYSMLDRFFPETWILDPRPIPPHAVVPGLYAGGVPLTDWQRLEGLTQKEREFVIKPSGFSELAWGSHGVKVGHDLSSNEWGNAIREAIERFPRGPYVLQRFHKAARVSLEYYDFDSGEMAPMMGRARLCPYYFVAGEDVHLGGILATVCPLDKKLIHGMVDAVMVPAAVRECL